MSVEQLILKDSPIKMIIMESNFKDCILIKIVNMVEDVPLVAMIMDHNQAHLLKLWLEEHLK